MSLVHQLSMLLVEDNQCGAKTTLWLIVVSPSGGFALWQKTRLTLQPAIVGKECIYDLSDISNFPGCMTSCL